jgi:hypothetical protein
MSDIRSVWARALLLRTRVNLAEYSLLSSNDNTIDVTSCTRSAMGLTRSSRLMQFCPYKVPNIVLVVLECMPRTWSFGSRLV